MAGVKTQRREWLVHAFPENQIVMRTCIRRSLLVLVLLTLPLVVQAQFNYVTNNGAITITGYTGPSGAVTIPDTINGLPVTSIGDQAFFANTSVTSVLMPNSITNIGNNAFWNCTSLTNATIPGAVSTIGRSAFGASVLLSNVTIPDGVKSIGSEAFYETSLTSVTIPGGLTNFGAGMFSTCFALTNVTIRDGVTSIGDQAFQNCYALATASLPQSLTNIGNSAFTACYTLTNFTIPQRVVRIGNMAFYGCNRLTHLTIPFSTTNIGFNAFYACTRLASVFFAGNAPTPNSSWFDRDTNNIYYLPGTKGWSSTYAGRPAYLWNPSIQTTNITFGGQTNQFGFSVFGTTNIPIVVEASTNPATPSWVPLRSCTLTNGSVYFSDPQWTNYPSRLYRLRSP